MPDVRTVDIDTLVERSGELKRELLEFSRRPRYSRPFQAALAAADLGQLSTDEDSLIAVVDRFVLQHRLRNGRTVVEEFVAARSDLPEPERTMLLGWQDVVEGVFEVVRREHDAVVLENLVDELTYRARSNMGAAVLRRMPRRSFVVTRLVPVGDEWLISGTVGTFAARRRDAVYRFAAQEAMNDPELAFRNPTKLARAWELQRADRERFVRFFGSDLVVMAGDEVDDRMRAFREACRSEIAGDRSGPLPPLVSEHSPDDDAETVGVIYDEATGWASTSSSASSRRCSQTRRCCVARATGSGCSTTSTTTPSRRTCSVVWPPGTRSAPPPCSASSCGVPGSTGPATVRSSCACANRRRSIFLVGRRSA